MGSILWHGFDFVRADAPVAVERALIARPLVFIGMRERQSVQRTTVQVEMSPLCHGLHQIPVPEPVSQYLQPIDYMQMGFIVGYALLWPGVCLVVAQPQRVVHDLMQPYENAGWVQHGIDPVEDIEHKLALLPDRTPVGVDRAGIIPVLQEVHQIHPFFDAMDSDIHLVILAVGRRSR